MKTHFLSTSFLIAIASWLAGQPSPNAPTCHTQCQTESLQYEDCLCTCLLDQAQTLRQAEAYDEAVNKLRAVEALCPDKKATTIIDTILQTHRIWVFQNGKFAVATPLGKALSGYIYDKPKAFSQGQAIAELNGKFYFVDSNGKPLTPRPGYDGIIPLEGSFYYIIEKGDYDTYNALVARNRFSPFRRKRNNKGFALAWKEWLGIRLPRQVLFQISQKDYQSIDSFRQGRAWVKKNDLFGFIDTSGKEICPPIYQSVSNFRQGRARVQKNDLFGFIDTSGKEIIPPIYQSVDDFSQGRARVQKNDLFGFIDTSGKEIIPPIYQSVDDFSQGRARVKKK